MNMSTIMNKREIFDEFKEDIFLSLRANERF